jgi:dienelactone hydrolase
MPRTLRLASIAGLAVFLAATARLAWLDRDGPPRHDVTLDGGVPATLYLPPGSGCLGAFLDPPPLEERPPAVVAMHGFAGDRLSMSGLSRRIAGSGYAVLAIDAAGHGANRTPFPPGRARPDAFAADLAASVDFLRVYPCVDGSRLAVLGHSMGAGAALDYATRDSGLDAAVMISGGFGLAGPYPAQNALFIFAAGDPQRVKHRARSLAARLTGVEEIELGRTYGRLDHGSAVRVVEVANANHQTIVWKQAAVAEIVEWLDAAFGRPHAPGPPPDDPRMPVLLLMAAALVLVLPGLGWLVGQIVPAQPPRAPAGRGLALLAVAGSLMLAAPLVAGAGGSPAEIVSAEVADVVVAHLALAGLALLAGIRLLRPELLRGPFERAPATLAGAALAVVAVFALQHPFGAVVHRTALTPERLAVFAMTGLGFLPLTLALAVLLRRGPPASAALFAVAGRAVVFLVLIASSLTLPGLRVLLVMLPSLAGVAVLIEVLAAWVYAASRNVLAIALVDAAWLALVAAAVVPVRI